MLNNRRNQKVCVSYDHKDCEELRIIASMCGVGYQMEKRTFAQVIKNLNRIENAKKRAHVKAYFKSLF